MSWKAKIENNLTLFVLSLLAGGFASGVGAYKVLIETSSQQFSTGRTELQTQLDLAKDAQHQLQVLRDQCERDKADQSNLASNLQAETKQKSQEIIATKIEAKDHIDRLNNTIDGCKKDIIEYRERLAAAAKRPSECQDADALTRKNADLSRSVENLRKDNKRLADFNQQCKNESNKPTVASKPDIDDNMKQIMLYLFRVQRATRGDVAKQFGITVDKTQYYIERLYHDYGYVGCSFFEDCSRPDFVTDTVKLTLTGRRYVVEQLGQ